MKANTLEAVGNLTEVELVSIPKGRFVMGSRDDNELAWDDEKPQHTLDIAYDFWIGRFPVCNAEFERFVHSTAFETRAEREGWCWVWNVGVERWERSETANWTRPLGINGNTADFGQHPVVQVCWYDALAFCEWLNQKYVEELPDDYHFRLPSEAEWEKAARGTDAHEWPWGNEYDSARCNSRDGGKLCTTSVGSHSPQGDSPYGVVGMSGNVWEWTLTLWGKDRENADFVYPYVSSDGRENQGADDEFFRIIRGGSFKDDIAGVRSACRDLDPPNYSLNNLGFRVVVAPALEQQD